MNLPGAGSHSQITSPAGAPIESEVRRIRGLSQRQRHGEALAAAAALARTAPTHRDVLYLIAVNQRCLRRIPEALASLERLEQRHAHFSLLYQERGHCYVTLRDAPRAIEAFLRAVAINPALTASWSMLERLYRVVGDTQNAATAAEHSLILQQLPPEVVQAGSRFSDGELGAAESILRDYRTQGGDHVEALRLLGRIAQQRAALDEAEQLLDALLQRAPAYRLARLDYIRVLIDGQKYAKARDQLDALMHVEPGNRDCLALYATTCAGLGDFERAIALYHELLAGAPEAADLQVSLAHALKAVGRQDEAIASYRAAAAARAGFGDAWWSLANLKIYRFAQDEIEAMRAQEAAATVQAIDRYPLCFALGKAFEDRGVYAESWHYYECGNALKRAEIRYRPEMTEANTRAQIATCTMDFFAARTGFGVADADPIFIVGLPRSGSTLIEQILASHSQVEGTQELPDIPRIVLELQGLHADPDHPRYPGVLAELTPEESRRLGERYMTDTRVFRGEGKPFFIDKMPNNFRHIGLIHLMLPNARIIDVRREPMACCFSNLKQLFASGQEFSYRIEDIARYYRTYVELMEHWDAVLPGRVLRVAYEELVEDLEGNVRRILAHCGLAFEPACTEFHTSERSVRTASSEQVRQPIFREGLAQWRHYEPWLGELKEALSKS